MPILQDPEQRFPKSSEPRRPSLSTNATIISSEESISTQVCDGPMPDASASWDMVQKEVVGLGKDGSDCSRGEVCTSDRNELMERIKRGESPTWIPSQTLQEEYSKHKDKRQLSPSSVTGHCEPAPLLPAAYIEDKSNTDSGGYAAELSPPSEIKRPHSALHAGDFNKNLPAAATTPQRAPVPEKSTGTGAQAIIGTSPTTQWHNSSQSSQSLDFSPPASPFSGQPVSNKPGPIPLRSRAPSLNSHLSGFVAKAPTTPLVQQSNNTDLDFSSVDRSISPGKSNRRHTLPPRPSLCEDLLSSAHASTFASTFASAARQPPSPHRDPTFPFHAQRPRRSLTTAWSLQASPSPQGPAFLRGRRQSHSSETSLLQNASMVGSYEESILRGWMSTAPSKPLDFAAQIGVLGRANCKPKCPAHVSIPFPAVFYSWSEGIGRKRSNTDDEPSPYVGHIDLQNLPTPAESKKTRRSRSKSPRDGLATESIDSFGHTARTQKKRRRTSPTPSDLQGGYRIPQKGQLQIIIKNPNKNAVKLFLVPYDLEDMQAGTKTFIRQRCCSTDPVIEGLLAKSNPEHNLPAAGNTSMSKPTLRYLIHVNICSPSNGRYYLYQHIRVVFANRVPDNKEQLQTEIQVPQPRYSAYNQKFALSRSTSGSGMRMARDKASRKRSAGFGVGLNGMDDRHPHAFSNRETSYPNMFDSSPLLSVPGVPFHLSSIQTTAEKLSPEINLPYNIGNDQHADDGEVPLFPIYGAYLTSQGPASLFQRLRQRPHNNTPESPGPVQDEPMDVDSDSGPETVSRSPILQSPLADKSNQRVMQSKSSNLSHSSNKKSDRYSKLSKGDAGYGGRSSTPERGEGLLARRLRGLEVRKGPEAVGKDDGREWDGRNSAW
ncbi:MAG: hypothetical protein Q9188_002934 [Gyalolechia gomerana]